LRPHRAAANHNTTQHNTKTQPQTLPRPTSPQPKIKKIANTLCPIRFGGVSGIQIKFRYTYRQFHWVCCLMNCFGMADSIDF
jgi:hypothetical protein